MCTLLSCHHYQWTRSIYDPARSYGWWWTGSNLWVTACYFTTFLFCWVINLNSFIKSKDRHAYVQWFFRDMNMHAWKSCVVKLDINCSLPCAFLSYHDMTFRPSLAGGSCGQWDTRRAVYKDYDRSARLRHVWPGDMEQPSCQTEDFNSVYRDICKKT